MKVIGVRLHSTLNMATVLKSLKDYPRHGTMKSITLKKLNLTNITYWGLGSTRCMGRAGIQQGHSL